MKIAIYFSDENSNNSGTITISGIENNFSYLENEDGINVIKKALTQDLKQKMLEKYFEGMHENMAEDIMLDFRLKLTHLGVVSGASYYLNLIKILFSNVALRRY